MVVKGQDPDRALETCYGVIIYYVSGPREQRYLSLTVIKAGHTARTGPERAQKRMSTAALFAGRHWVSPPPGNWVGKPGGELLQ